MRLLSARSAGLPLSQGLQRSQNPCRRDGLNPQKTVQWLKRP